ncbi:MAG: DUF1491 family protein [Alphaproteobacteria bacterium]|nr:DUF1491 family protein [Alphaproteobacteria bacterium]MCB9929940.1 DUF1491 family protein [Alphaproteobacteria bacterium]
MQPARLRARLWVEACLGACRAAGVFATVLARGDADAGTVLLKWRRTDGSGGVLSPYSSPDGVRIWLPATGQEPVAEAEADAYWQRQKDRDPDVWVVEVESETLWHPLQEPIDLNHNSDHNALQEKAKSLFRR